MEFFKRYFMDDDLADTANAPFSFEGLEQFVRGCPKWVFLALAFRPGSRVHCRPQVIAAIDKKLFCSICQAGNLVVVHLIFDYFKHDLNVMKRALALVKFEIAEMDKGNEKGHPKPPSQFQLLEKLLSEALSILRIAEQEIIVKN
jgi:hypothetical protein